MKAHPLRLAAYLALSGSALVGVSAHAAGTAAGTIITNTATGSFTYGDNTSTVQSNTTSVRVDEVLDAATTSLASGPVQMGSASSVVPFRITNAGNGSEAFKVSVLSSNVGNQFAPVVSAIILDTNGNKTYDPGVDQPLISGANTAALAAGASLDAFVVVTLPQGVTDGQTAQVRLVAEAATGSGTPGTILPGKGQGGGDAVVGATTAISNSLGSLIASSISLAITKTATVVDPYGHSAVIPGSIITFQLKAVFTGSASASNAHIVDFH